MSADDPRPRHREILIATVNALRDDDALAGLLYDDPPTDAAQRQRVHETWGGPEDAPPVEVTVEPVASGSETRGGPRTETSQLQCSVLTTESWRDGHGALAMHGIRDRCKAVLESPVAEGVYPAGGGGRDSPIEPPGESGRLLLPLTVGVRTHWLTH